MGDLIKSALGSLEGYKTHAFVVLAFVWAAAVVKVPALLEFVGKDNAGLVFMGLLTAGGVSFKSAQNRQEAKQDAIQTAVAPQTVPLGQLADIVTAGIKADPGHPEAKDATKKLAEGLVDAALKAEDKVAAAKVDAPPSGPKVSG